MINSSPQEEDMKPTHGYNHSMLYINILSSHYLCVSNESSNTDSRLSKHKVYIGKQWENVIFPDGKPLIIASDFFHFLKTAQEGFAGVRSLFNLSAPIRIYVEHENLAPFFMYFLYQTEHTFGLSSEIIRIILKKTNERFWIWDNKRLGLSIELYSAFKEELGAIQLENDIFEGRDITCLPLEYLLLFFSKSKVGLAEIINKFNQIKPQLVSMSLIQTLRSGLETVLNDPRVLKEYNGLDIEEYDDILPELQKDELLNALFIQRISTENISWLENNMDQIKHLMGLLKRYDLDQHDPFPSYDEFREIQELFYSQNQEKALLNILSGERVNLHELDFFKEYHHKINVTLINYISRQLSLEGSKIR